MLGDCLAFRWEYSTVYSNFRLGTPGTFGSSAQYLTLLVHLLEHTSCPEIASLTGVSPMVRMKGDECKDENLILENDSG